MAGGGGGPISRALMGDQTPAQGEVQYAPAQTRPTYQPAFSSQQAPAQTGPTTGGPGIGPMNHMVQPTAELKPNAGPSSFTPMPIMANDPLAQFGDKPPITATSQQLAPQQMMPRAPQNLQGLQGLLSQMMSRYQNPFQMMQRGAVPQYRSSALNYRPNMTNAQQALTRVKPSVYKTDLDTARARIAELEAAQAAEQNNSYYSGGG
jgi:hypothetical protein